MMSHNAMSNISSVKLHLDIKQWHLYAKQWHLDVKQWHLYAKQWHLDVKQ
jgi:hypothetical protein